MRISNVNYKKRKDSKAWARDEQLDQEGQNATTAAAISTQSVMRKVIPCLTFCKYFKRLDQKVATV